MNLRNASIDGGEVTFWVNLNQIAMSAWRPFIPQFQT